MEWSSNILVFILLSFLIFYLKRFPKILSSKLSGNSFTLIQLSKFDGRENLIYIGCNDKVFNVTNLPKFSPGGKYEFLVGRDATMLFAKEEIDGKYINAKHEKLSEEEEGRLQNWEKYFMMLKRCEVVGKLALD
ncbi:unnamed protein product [Blepharisma stoltei]|uniref:Cytochrome b5 heme-binding domain-containing protein n=1 Tax=Blepharisma stoltei TaxID=1481888 RepID=A0AAU9K5J3_9CILI|nr:unnamed protein product [Blepharisma stoltei]